jgi:hypothetical protein
MNPLRIIPTPEYKKSFKKLFKKLFKKYPSLKSDYSAFIKEYTVNRKLGDDLGGGFRKIRMSIQPKNKGKSGGVRIILYEMYVKEQNDTIILVDIYNKSELETMNAIEYKSILNSFINE